MPRLRFGGHVVAPLTGLGAVSVDGVVVHSAGSEANWLSDTEVLFQACDQTCQLLVYDLTTGGTRVVDGQGANWLRGRDGGWAAWLNGLIRTSAGWVYPDSGYLCEVAAGQVWITEASMHNLHIFSLSGEPIDVWATGPLGQDATAGVNVRVRDGLLLYQDYAGWHLVETATLTELPIAPRTTEYVNYAVPLRIDGEPWLLERTNRLTLRPATSTLGYVITEGLCYGADAVVDDSGVWVAWSVSQGEPPFDIRVIVPELMGPPLDLDAPPPHTDAPHTDHSDAPHTDHADAPHTDVHTDHADAPHNDTPTHTDVPHTDGPEPAMESRNLISLDGGKTWIETREMPHQDGTRDMGPIVAVQNVKDGTYLRGNSLGDLDWTESDAPGADERWINVPGAYVGIRENNIVVMRAGAWTQ